MKSNARTEPTEKARYLPSYDCVTAAPKPYARKFFVCFVLFVVNFTRFQPCLKNAKR